MPGVLRSLAGRAVWAGVVAAALRAPAAAQGPELPDDPIAASNRLTALPPPPPEIRLTAADVPWLVPTPDDPPPAEPPAVVLPPRSLVSAPMPAAPMPVTWSAPARRPPITAALPTSDRPLIPCEPAVPDAPALASGERQPPGSLPSERAPDRLSAHQGAHAPRSPEPPPPPPKPSQPTMTAAPDDDPPARTVTTCRFLDDPAPPKPAAADDATLILAVIRRGGQATGTAGDIRAAVEKVCRGKAVECQTEVAGERQVRVLLTVRSAADWRRLYARLQDLPQLGQYGLLFQVRVRPEPEPEAK